MNVYQMYVANGNKAGFYVRRKNWSNAVRVVSIVGRTEGELPGQPPYFDNPVVLVSYGSGSLRELSCPGTYQYVLVE